MLDRWARWVGVTALGLCAVAVGLALIVAAVGGILYLLVSALSQ